jgi:hypothetical protein
MTHVSRDVKRDLDLACSLPVGPDRCTVPYADRGQRAHRAGDDDPLLQRFK